MPPTRWCSKSSTNPTGPLDAVWNDLLAEALAVIRRTNPTRNVIIGPAFWNNVGWLPKLVLPGDDRHIIVTVHYYLPMRFTHQGARWTPEYVNLSGITWGTPQDLATLDQDFDAVQKWARENDRPILLGEFGAYDKGPMESRVKYTAAVARAAEKRGWAWAYWQFDSDFIVYDIDKDQWVEPIRDALIPTADTLNETESLRASQGSGLRHRQQRQAAGSATCRDRLSIDVDRAWTAIADRCVQGF